MKNSTILYNLIDQEINAIYCQHQGKQKGPKAWNKTKYWKWDADQIVMINCFKVIALI